jgi:hypothetical protein
VGTDATAAVTGIDGPATVSATIDHCTAECVGIHAARHGDRFEALEPLRQGVRDHFGAIPPAVAHMGSRSGTTTAASISLATFKRTHIPGHDLVAGLGS